VDLALVLLVVHVERLKRSVGDLPLRIERLEVLHERFSALQRRSAGISQFLLAFRVQSLLFGFSKKCVLSGNRL